jgi:mono/diheme cytochrome c family protein
MNVIERFVTIGWLLTLTGAALSAQAPAQPAPAGNAENGRKLYMSQTCYYCHGTAGQGTPTPAVGVRIAQVPRSLDSFVRYVRRPSGRMSAFPEETLSNAALTDIYAYLRSIAPARPVREIALLEGLRPK